MSPLALGFDWSLFQRGIAASLDGIKREGAETGGASSTAQAVLGFPDREKTHDQKTSARTDRRGCRGRRCRYRPTNRNQAHAAAKTRFPGRLQHHHRDRGSPCWRRRGPPYPSRRAETGYVLEG